MVQGTCLGGQQQRGVRGTCEGHTQKAKIDGGGVESERKDHSSYWVSGLGKQVTLGKVGKVHGEEIYLASTMFKVMYFIFECLFDMSSRHMWLVIIFNK